MFFDLNEDQRSLQSAVRGLLEKVSPENMLIRRIDERAVESHNAALFCRLCTELDVLGASLPLNRGGSGAGLTALFVVFRELGRVVYGGPFLPSLLAAETLVAVDPDGIECDAELQALIKGFARGTVVGLPYGAAPEITAVKHDSTWLLSGKVPHVFDGLGADTVLVFAQADGTLGCFLPERSADIQRSSIEPLDLCRPLADLYFDAVPARRLDTPGAGSIVHDRICTIAALCVAAEQVGVAERALEMALEHAKFRKQFGVPIGSFQAVKHRCANAAMAVEAASATALHAAWALDGNWAPDRPMASLAKSICVEASIEVTGSTMQVLGGLGFTWEHPIHLFYRRSIASRQSFGSTFGHREQIASALLDHV